MEYTGYQPSPTPTSSLHNGLDLQPAYCLLVLRQTMNPLVLFWTLQPQRHFVQGPLEHNTCVMIERILHYLLRSWPHGCQHREHPMYSYSLV